MLNYSGSYKFEVMFYSSWVVALSNKHSAIRNIDKFRKKI